MLFYCFFVTLFFLLSFFEGIHENFAATFNRQHISVEAVKADGNGAYRVTGCPKRCYFMDDSGVSIARKVDGLFYVNQRLGSKYAMKEVDSQRVYELTCVYRQSKENKSFVQMIASVV